MGDDDRLCDKEDVKSVNVDGSTGVVGVGVRLGGVSIRSAEVENGWDNWRRLIPVRDGEAFFRKREAVARICRRRTGVSVVRSATRGPSAGNEWTELWGLVDFLRSLTLGRGVIICRIRPVTP